jgi:hypothetical protein
VSEDSLPGWIPASTAGQIAVGYVAGTLLARLLGFALPLRVGSFAFTLSILAFPVAFWTGARAALRPRAVDARTRVALAGAVGVVGDELVYLGARAEGVGYWAPLSIAGSVTVGIAALALVGVLASRSDEELPSPPGRWLTALSALAVAASYVGYRVSQIYLRRAGVPNDERSLVLAGYEAHHASTGSLLLVAGAVALTVPGLDRRTHRVAALVFAVGAGFVADEYLYLFYPVMTDELYFGVPSVVGGLAATGTVILFLVYNYRVSLQEG